MNHITYHYENVTYAATYIHYLEDGYDRYQVTLDDGRIIKLIRLGINPKIWLQDVKRKGEYNYPHHFAQVVGEGIDVSLANNRESDKSKVS